MRGWEIGLVFAFLSDQRIIRSAAEQGQRLRKNEQDLARFLEYEATSEEKACLDHFLQAQGFRLHRYDSYDMPGIKRDQYVFLLLRDGEGVLTPWADAEEAVECVRHRHGTSSEPKDHARVWLCQIWFSMLYLQYPKLGRSFSEVSRYQEAAFTRDHLADAIRETLESRRQENVAEPSLARTILLDSESPRISDRVRAFLQYMVKIGHLVEVEKNVFRQTLLASAELGVNFNDGLGLLVDLDPAEEEDAPISMRHTEQAFDLAENDEIGQEQEM